MRPWRVGGPSPERCAHVTRHNIHQEACIFVQALTGLFDVECVAQRKSEFFSLCCWSQRPIRLQQAALLQSTPFIQESFTRCHHTLNWSLVSKADLEQSLSAHDLSEALNVTSMAYALASIAKQRIVHKRHFPIVFVVVFFGLFSVAAGSGPLPRSLASCGPGQYEDPGDNTTCIDCAAGL